MIYATYYKQCLSWHDNCYILKQTIMFYKKGQHWFSSFPRADPFFMALTPYFETSCIFTKKVLADPSSRCNHCIVLKP